jgi:isopentenyldiphosphate isomerase
MDKDHPLPDNPAEDDSEVLDLLDKEGNVVGKTRRGDAHGNPVLRHRAVHVFVVNSRGEYFLQQRSTHKKIQPGKWDTSVGGHVPRGESYEQGALRELQEELGIRLEDPSLLKRHHDFVWESPFETEHTRTFLLEWDGPFRLNPMEVSDGRWWDAREIRATSGKRVFTPNLEVELGHLGLIT